MKAVPNVFEPGPSSRENGGIGEEEFLVYCLRAGLDIQLSLGPYSNCDFKVSGKRVDVKTISNDFGPLPDFNVNVPSCQVSLEQDLFAFVFHDKTTETYTIAGAVGREDLLRKGILKRKGESERNGKFIYKCDTYVLKVGELLPMEAFAISR